MIDYITAHYQDFLAIVGAVVTLATLIVKLTPSQKDDAVLGYVVKFLDYFSVVNPKK
jgi:hypothetical protein